MSVSRFNIFNDGTSSPVSWLIPIRNWLQVTSEDGVRSWYKVVVITGTVSGAVVATYYIVKKCTTSSSSTNTKKCDSNGTAVKTANGSAGSIARPSTLISSPVKSKARTEFEYDMVDTLPGDQGLGLLLSNSNAEDSDFNLYSHISTPRGFAGTSSFRRRPRSDSITSGTTTLMLTSRDPSELLLYGLESLKRSIRLWEETRNKLVMVNDGFGEL